MPDTVALDIGSYSIKVVQGKPGKAVKVTHAFEIPNTVGVGVPGDDATVEKLATLMTDIFRTHNLPKKDVRLSLPESLVSNKVISIPPLTDAELASAIQWLAEQHIPIPPDELSLEYQVLERPAKHEKDKQMVVLLVGVRRSVVDSYLNVFVQADIEPTFLETHTLSILRSLQFTAEDPATLLVHIGATTTEMAIVSNGQLSFVFNHASAGQVLTRTIEQSLQIDPKQAEQYKRSYGIDATQLQGSLREILLPVLSMTLSEMQKAIQFYASQNPGQPIKRILLSGGTAQLPGLVEFITEQLAIEVLVASPFTGASGEVPQANQLVYPVAMGLMVREK